MPASERVVTIAGDWMRKAENDLMNAVHTLKLGAGGPTDTVCFHAQQCTEKYLKAMLVLRAIEKLKGAPEWSVLTVRTGHHAMLDDPEGFARMLLEAA